jgi:hypothetical protein
MSTTKTSVSGALKNIYEVYHEKAQNLKHRSIDEIGKSLKKYNAGGNGYFGAINDYGNEAGGAQNESESFRTIDNENYTQWKVIPKVIIWPIEFTGLVAASADSDEEAFAEIVVDALDQAKERLLSDENRQFFGIGTGALASPSANAASTVTSFAVDSTQYLRRNQVIDVFNGATKTIDSKRISRVDHANKVVYFATSIGAALITTDVMVKENIRDSAPSDGKEMMGLRGIIDDGTDVATFQNVSVAANDEWKATRIDASSGNLSSDLLQRLLDDVSILGGEECDLLMSHPKQRRKYLDLVVPQKRYQDGNMDTGFTELSFNGKRMLLDKDCQSDVVYALQKKSVRKFEVDALKMGGHEDSDKFLRTTNQDVFQAYWRHYCNFGASQRTTLGKLVSLATPTGLS